jgi:cytochrome c553
MRAASPRIARAAVGPPSGPVAAMAALAAVAGTLLGAAGLLAALACAGFPGTAHGRPAGADEGARIAAQGTADGGAACVACHGERGEGRAGALMPRLAGQPAGYLASQLDAYADGRRPHPVMTPIARALDEAQRRAVAGHYAALPVESRGTRTPPGAPATGRAATLARVGDAKIGVQACANCHGPDGSGVAPDMPGLAGQHADYLLAALRAWRDGERRTDPSGQMPGIAKRLREPDLQSLARHFAAMPPGLPRHAGGEARARAGAAR